VIYRSVTANHSSAVVLSAGTDGRVCLWDVTVLVTSFCQIYCHRCRPSHTESQNENIVALNCVASGDRCFTSLTETVSADVAEQYCGDSLQKTVASDTLAAFNSSVGNTRSFGLTEATERLAVFHSSSSDTVSSGPTNVCGRQAQFHRSLCVAASSEEAKTSDRQAVFDCSSNTTDSSELNKASERQGGELEPCCVITAHQSGVNSLAVRQRHTGNCVLTIE